MVYESRPGDVFVLGSTSWRIDEITHDRVIVLPAPGQPAAKLPFWHGDAAGRPVELGRAVGEVVRHLGGLDSREVRATLVDRYRLDPWAADNLAAFLDEEREATGVLPTDRTVVVQRFRDEIGDWRMVVLTPFGARVHAPWALAARHRLRTEVGSHVDVIWSDDGIVFRFPDLDEPPPATAVVPSPDEIEDLLLEEVADSALFTSRFREAAARALLLPRRRPGSRTPLWQQRRRAAGLLEVAAKHPDFPIVLETYREVLQDHFDLPALTGLLGDIAARRVRVHELELKRPQPVRLLADVRLRRLVHVRVRRPGGGAAGGGAHPRSEVAGGPARRSRPQRPARPGGDRPGRARAPAARPGTEGALRRRRPRCAPPPGAADPRRAAGAGGTARAGRWARRRSRRRAPDRAGGGQRVVAARRRRGHRPAARRPRGGAAAGDAGRPARTGVRPARRPGRPVCPHPRAVRRARGGRRPGHPCRRGDRSARPARRGRPGRQRRLPQRGGHGRVGGCGGAAPDQEAIAGGAARRGRSGRRRHAGSIPARLAGRRHEVGHTAATPRSGAPASGRLHRRRNPRVDRAPPPARLFTGDARCVARLR